MKIIIGADLVPTESNFDLFKKGDAKTLIGNDLLITLKSADYSLFNLEVPITDCNSPIEKFGPNLIAPTVTIAGLKAINPHFFGLANNHILDQGVKGLKNTIETLEKAGIDYSGVGNNINDACKPFIKEIDGKKIGIYCCAEHEYSIATYTRPGANPFDPLVSLDHIVELKNSVDYVIVLYHGGKEHYRYPSPYLQKVCRRIVDKGADLVVCQHSHCIGCEEKYRQGTIVYGQGNFLFDDSESEFWKTGLLIELDDNFKISYLPIMKYENKVRLASERNKIDILEEFYKRSQEIKNPEFVRKKYAEFAKNMETEYLLRFSGAFRRNLFVRIFNNLTSYKFIKRFYLKDNQLAIENAIDCEAHRELAIEALRRCRR